MKCEVGSDDGTGKFDTARNFDVTFPLTPALCLRERENHSRRLSQSNSALIQIAAGLETRGPSGLWGKTRRDKGFSFRLDTKVVPKYPVKA